MSTPQKTLNQLAPSQKKAVMNRKNMLHEGLIFYLPNDTEYEKTYPLHSFVLQMSDDEPSVQILKKMTEPLGKDIFTKNDDKGRNLLLIAIGMNKLGVLDMMMTAGANAALFNRKLHITPLGYAAYDGFHQALSVMLKRGADPFLKMDDSDRFNAEVRNSTLLHRLPWMGRDNREEVINVLLPYYPDLSLQAGDGKTITDALMGELHTQNIIEEELHKRAKKLQTHLESVAEPDSTITRKPRL